MSTSHITAVATAFHERIGSQMSHGFSLKEHLVAVIVLLFILAQNKLIPHKASHFVLIKLHSEVKPKSKLQQLDK